MFIAVALLSALARRLGAASPVVMLLAGLAIAFVPGMPQIALAPDLVLLAFLPPLLYSSGVGMSWRGFRSNLRPILLMAIGCVLFTAAAVAVVMHYVMGLPWALGFVLGAIVSPPDSVAPIALLRHMRLPRRMLTILEGESLVNDATALVTLSFALQALETGAFSPSAAAHAFRRHRGRGNRCSASRSAISCCGCANSPPIRAPRSCWRWRRRSSPSGRRMRLGGSGVVACVACGLYVSWNGRNFISSATRLQGYFIWDLVNWCIEAMAFFVTGMETRVIVANLSSEGWPTLLAAGALVCVTVIVVRFAWVFPVTYLPRLLWPPLRKREPAPNWRPPFLIGYTGLRGAVSLAAALAIPLTLHGAPFPHRDLILFATICVIVATLVGQGSALVPIVEWLGLGRVGAREAAASRRAEAAARIKGIDAALGALDRVQQEVATSLASLDAVRQHHQVRRAMIVATADETTPDDPVHDSYALRLRLIGAERAAINAAYEAGQITDEGRRRAEREFDLEEATIRHALRDNAEALEDAQG